MIELERSKRENKLAAKLIELGKDDFDLEIARMANELMNRVCQQRDITRTAAAKIVSDFLQVPA